MNVLLFRRVDMLSCSGKQFGRQFFQPSAGPVFDERGPDPLACAGEMLTLLLWDRRRNLFRCLGRVGKGAVQCITVVEARDWQIEDILIEMSRAPLAFATDSVPRQRAAIRY